MGVPPSRGIIPLSSLHPGPCMQGPTLTSRGNRILQSPHEDGVAMKQEINLNKPETLVTL